MLALARLDGHVLCQLAHRGLEPHGHALSPLHLHFDGGGVVGHLLVHNHVAVIVLVHPTLSRRSRNIGEDAVQHQEEVEREVVHLVDNLAGLEVGPAKGHRQQQGQARGHLAESEAEGEELVLQQPAAEQVRRQLAQDPARDALAGDQVLHLLPVVAARDPGLGVPSNPVGHHLPLLGAQLGVVGEGLHKFTLLVAVQLGIVNLGDNGDHLADDDRVNHGAHHHGEANVDDLARGGGADVAEAHGREDGEHEVEGVDPLLEGVLLQQGLHVQNRRVSVNVSSVHPRVPRILVQRRAQVPATREEVSHPDQAHGVVEDAHPAESLDPQPDAVRGLEARELRKAHQARQPRQARDPLKPPNAQGLIAGEVAIQIAGCKGHDESLDHLFWHTGDEVDGEVAREVVPADEPQAVDLVTKGIAVGEEEVGEEVHPEDAVDHDLEGLPAARAVAAVLPLVPVYVEFDEAYPVEEDRRSIRQQQRDEQVPQAAAAAALVHNKYVAAVVALRSLPPLILDLLPDV
mmetsp:Transcript_42637/g.110196  ORF Transcript_42637/g.110196 Transcript_42637/m.110196 type:complete len:517 (+) Transcript_42637:921-2471(+)